MTGGYRLDPEVALRERLTRIEVEAQFAHEAAQDLTDAIGRMNERLDLYERRIGRNEGAILGLQDKYAWMLKSHADLKRSIAELLADRERRRIVVATLKYAAGGVLLTLVATGHISALQASLARGLLSGLP